MMATKLRIAPETMPLDIIGTVALKNVFSLEAPREMEASSIDIGIWISVAVALRMVYGSLRTTQATIMINSVPEMAIGFLLKEVSKAMPMTEPGMMYGSIDTVSMASLATFLLLTVR